MKRLAILAFMGALLLGLACSKDGISPTISEKAGSVMQNIPPETETLINKYVPSDEELLQGSILPTNVVPPDLSDTSWDIFAVTFLWGHLFSLGDSSGSISTDWSGSMSINGVSIIAPVKPIHFEDGQDSILERPDNSDVAWVSSTSGDFDGVTCLIFLKRGIVYFTTPRLTFSTQPITLEFDFRQLEDLKAFYRVDSINGLAVHSRRIWPHHCAEGNLIGKWIKTENAGDSGYFNGQWLDEKGNVSGVFAGSFWVTENGHRVFDGWISHPILDVIIGRIGGTWYYDDPRMCPLCGSGYGRFKGIFKYFNEPRFGSIEGEIFEHSIGSLDMTLKGQWKQHCSFDADYSFDATY